MSICNSNNIGFYSFQDFLLVEPYEVEQRKVFTPFSLLWKKFILANLSRLEIQQLRGDECSWYTPQDHREIGEIISVPYHRYWTLDLGQSRMKRDFTQYDDLRNIP
jgi:hypothetical protein